MRGRVAVRECSGENAICAPYRYACGSCRLELVQFGSCIGLVRLDPDHCFELAGFVELKCHWESVAIFAVI